ncbi:MAG: aldo/keto reductase [Parvibaculaceae bacterium]
MKHVTLPGGETVPALGLGTWRMGEKRSEKAREVELLRAGLDMGFTLIDTAEMYGEGGAEEVTGEAVKGRRDGVFIVSKVYPHNASREGAVAACERSLKRLGTDRIDLYLLHWPGSHPLADTVAAFEQLKAEGKIRHWGVSNFDTAGMRKVAGVPGGGACAANQVLYHLGTRGIEWELLPAMQKAKIAAMAYSPLGQGPLLSKPALVDLARSLGISAATLALAWMLRQPGVIAIPKTSRKERLKDFLGASDLELDTATIAALDKAFPPPKRAAPLAMN